MKLTTTFWSEKVETLDTLLYINGKTKEIVAQANLNNKNQTYLFFKSLSKFIQTKKVLDSYKENFYENPTYYQFATILDNEITPIKWFDLVIDDKTTISHDIAFNTTLIKINDLRMPFGKFPMWLDKKLPKYREFKLKAKCYKFIANKIAKSPAI